MRIAASSSISSQLDYFTMTEWAVIQALGSTHPRLLTQEAVARATNDSPSVRTIARLLPKLREAGFVVQPKGRRGGWGLSEAGLKAAGRSG